MLPECSRLKEFKAQWPYLLVLPPLLAEWGRLRGLAEGWLGLGTETFMVLLTLAMIVIIQRQRRRLEEASITDKLTGLFNSRHLRAELDRQVALAQRVGSPLSMIFMDLDRFKAFNDRYGHALGNQLLRRFARALLAAVREHVDLCFRFGGDEFLVLCPHTQVAEAAGIAERVLGVQIGLPGCREEQVTLSVAVTELKEEETSLQFLQRADGVLYRIKRSGRARMSLGE